MADRQGVIATVRKTIRELDPALPITQVRTMRQSVDMATALPREMMLLVLGFATVALAMSTLGLSGVMAYSVSRRTREIGLRMALGARAGDVSRAVIQSAARLVLAGSAMGLALAFAGARVLESVLYGVRPHDPAVMFGAPVLLAAIALTACLIPARRAASVEPMTALRQE
jgi:ABC-type antimicrobial peptide transport system permease subunit